jgi:hypothetical protein
MTWLYISGSIFLMSLQLIGQYILSRKNRWGWMVMMGVLVIGEPYEYITHQYGFLAGNIFYFIVALNGWRRWKLDEEK